MKEKEESRRRREKAAETASRMGFSPVLSTIVELDDGKWRMFAEGGKTYLVVEGTVMQEVGGR